MQRVEGGRHRSSASLIAIAAIVAGLAACGGGGGDGGAGAHSYSEQSAEYFPLGTGDRWIYRSDDNGVTEVQQVDVTVTTVGGSSRPSLTTSSLDGTVQDVSPFDINSSGVILLPTPGDAFSTALGAITLMPGLLSIGSSFTQIDRTIDGGADLDGDGRNEPITLTATVQVVERGTVTTTAGRFEAAVHLRTTLVSTTTFTIDGFLSTQQYISDDWYAPRVGLVRSELAIAAIGTPPRRSTTELIAYRVGNAHAGPAPTVNGIAPDDAGLHNGRVAVTARFDAPMDRASLNSGGFQVRERAAGNVAGTVFVTPDGLSATFIPTGGWISGNFVAEITAVAADRVGNAAVPRTWTFDLDAVAPMVVAANPLDGATHVATDTRLAYTFSEALDPATIYSAGFPAVTVTDDLTGAAVPAAVVFDGMAGFAVEPRGFWTHGHAYTVAFPAGLSDRIGNPVEAALQLRFTTAPTVFTTPQPQSASTGRQLRTTIGDVTGDGRADLLWTAWDESFSGQRMFLRRGMADGSLAPAVEPFPGNVLACGVASIAMGDINGDGRTDVVIGGGACGIRVLLQNVDGGLSAGPSYTLGNLDYPGVIRLVDINGDGRLDMLWTGNSTAVRVWLQTAAGVFADTTTLATGLGALTSLELVDLNSDGILDIVVASIGSQPEKLAVLRGTGGGGFGPPVVLPTGDGWPSGVAVGDVNGDGRPDIVVSMRGSAEPKLLVFYQQLDRSFAASVVQPLTLDARGVGLVDVDADGRLDLLVGHADAFALLRQRVDRGFALPDLYGEPAPALGEESITVGTPDGDGRVLIEVNGKVFRPLGATAPALQSTPVRPMSALPAKRGALRASRVGGTAAR